MENSEKQNMENKVKESKRKLTYFFIFGCYFVGMWLLASFYAMPTWKYVAVMIFPTALCGIAVKLAKQYYDLLTKQNQQSK